ncbi:MAG: TIGR02270 family protein [Leptothrix sp. (in: b-proteobacteria)]
MDMPSLFQIPVVVSQHAEESTHLRHVRSVLTRSPHVQLHRLQRLDDRIAAHLDGIAVAGDFGLKLCLAALETPSAGAVFTLAVRALKLKDAALLQRLFAIVAAEPAAERGLLSAFGWVPAQALQGTIRALLTSADAAQRAAGLVACVMHRVDPGPALVAALADPDTRLRARALRVAGEAGRVDLLPQMLATCVADGAAEDEALRFWAARSALLLGDRSAAVLAVLAALAEGSGAWSDTAAEWLLKVLDVGAAHQHLRGWSERAKAPGPTGAAARRRLIRRCGVLGDAYFIPWLIGQMADLQVSRLAGEAFTLMTGADLAKLDLERKPPEGASDGQFGGPNEDPADDFVALDEDESLSWPDPERVQGWWQANQARFPAGQRFFMGAAPSPALSLKVLREGGQRQRIAAAQWASLLAPGTKLFQTAAPAWRQQRWLADG